MINVEPPEPIFRVLGRNHVFIDGPAEPQEHDLNAAVSALKGAVAFGMNDYARQTVELFCSITGTQSEKLRKVTTPFCPDGSLPPEDDQSAGELAPNACKLLMKALWLGRLARPDIIKLGRSHKGQLARSSPRSVCGCRLCWRKGCEVHVRWLLGPQRTEHPFSFSMAEQTTDISVEIHHRSQDRFAHVLFVSRGSSLLDLVGTFAWTPG